MTILDRKFTTKEINSLLQEDSIYDENDDKVIFELVEKEFSSSDREKNSTEYNVIMVEIETGKFWSSELGESPWCDQDEYNAKQEWREVFKKTYTKTYYE